jgi:hypothetical protein
MAQCVRVLAQPAKQAMMTKIPDPRATHASRSPAQAARSLPGLRRSDQAR